MVALMAVLAVAACGSNSKKSSNSTASTAATTSAVSASAIPSASAPPVTPAATAAVATATSVATAATAPASATTSAAATTAAAQSHNLFVTTTDNKYSQTSFTVKAGQQYTLTQINKGQAIHNWHVLDVKSSDGSTIMTPLTSPGKNSSVTFTISKPGTYHFHCDVHPTEMMGTITVTS